MTNTLSTETLPISLQRLIGNGHLSKAVSTGDHCLLYLRHSDRPPIPPHSAGYELNLTPAGVARARQLGYCLKELGIEHWPCLISSPMTRNVETLTEICNGAGWAERVGGKFECDPRIFGKGVIFDENTDFGTIIRSLGGPGFSLPNIFNEIFAGNEKRFPGVKPLAIGGKGLLSMVKDALDRPVSQEAGPCLSIMVSHDLSLAFILGHLFGVRNFTDETFPPFLDSILFRKTENGFEAIYGDKIVQSDGLI